MKMPRVLGMLVAAALAAGIAGSAARPTAQVLGAEADKAKEVFETLHGQDLARVAATADPSDDVELAKRLLEAAKNTTDQPTFLALLCQTACDLGLGHPDGYPTAAQAMELLSGRVPEKARPCRDRLLKIRQKQFDAAQDNEKAAAAETLLDLILAMAEEQEKAGATAGAAALYRRAQTVASAAGSPREAAIETRAAALALQIRIARQIADVKALLERDPHNVGAREGLVRIYLLDLDAPAEAARHLQGVADKALLKYVPAAAKGVEAAPDLACLELGEWYRDLAGKAPSHAKAAVYARARKYLERFLEIHVTKDLDHTRATAALRKIEEAVDQLAAAKTKPKKPSPTPTNPWIELLTLVDPTKDVVKGAWQRTDGALALAARQTAAARIVLPVAPQGNYELLVRFERTSGNDTIAVALPVGTATAVTLVLSISGGSVSGLERVHGQEARHNETAVRPGTVANGREHLLHVSVSTTDEEAQIAVALDGRRYLGWRGPTSALSQGAWWKLPQSACLGLGANWSNVLFRSVRLRMLSGKATRLRGE